VTFEKMIVIIVMINEEKVEYVRIRELDFMYWTKSRGTDGGCGRHEMNAPMAMPNR